MSSSTPSKGKSKQQHHQHPPPNIQPLAPQPVLFQQTPTLASSSIQNINPDLLPSPLSAAKKRKLMEQSPLGVPIAAGANPGSAMQQQEPAPAQTPDQPVAKKARTNTPWTPAEEKRLKQMRDAGNTWSEIAKTFPNRTEGSVKKHWYKDMHYADFAEDESAALLQAIKDYDANKWKVIGQKVGKPAKACEQYAKENFAGRL